MEIAPKRHLLDWKFGKPSGFQKEVSSMVRFGGVTNFASFPFVRV
jgi:hypothetical protein